MTGLSNPPNVSRPSSCRSRTIAIEPAALAAACEITRSNPSRQDFVNYRADDFSRHLPPSDVPFVAFGTAQNDTMLGGYPILPQGIHTVNVHIGVSISSVKAPGETRLSAHTRRVSGAS